MIDQRFTSIKNEIEKKFNSQGSKSPEEISKFDKVISLINRNQETQTSTMESMKPKIPELDKVAERDPKQLMDMATKKFPKEISTFKDSLGLDKLDIFQPNTYLKQLGL